MRRIRAELRAQRRRESELRLQAVLKDPTASEDERAWAELILGLTAFEDVPELQNWVAESAA